MPYQTATIENFHKTHIKPDHRFENLLKIIPQLTSRGPWLAGGSVRKYMSGFANNADYDFFFRDQEQCNQFCEELLNSGATELGKNIFNRCFDLEGFRIQAIHHEFRNTLIQTMDRFDITICQYGFDGTKFVWSDQAFQDVKDGTLHFLGTTDPVYNLNRAFKYASEGFKPADGEVKKVLDRVAKGTVSVKNGRKISGAGTSNVIVNVSDDFLPQGGGVYIGPVGSQS